MLFYDFIISPCNKKAYEAAMKFFKNPYDENFLFLLGDKGTGKTTLARCIMRSFISSHDKFFIPGEDFPTFKMDKQGLQHPGSIINRMLRVALLIIDDLDKSNLNNVQQSVLLEILEHRRLKNKQTLITCTNNLGSNFDEPFREFMKSVPTTQLNVIQGVDRKTFIEYFAKSFGLILTDNDKNHLIETIGNDIQMIEDTIKKLSEFSHLKVDAKIIELEKYENLEFAKKVSLKKVIGYYSSIRAKGTEFTTNCPFHNDSRSSLVISEEKGIFKCFICESSGDAISFIRKIERIGFNDAIDKIARNFKVQRSSST